MRGKVVLLGGLAQRWAPAKKIFTQLSAFLLVLVILFSAVPFEAEAASSTSNYWYNGVELPPLPSDLNGYFNFIVKYPSNGFYYCITCPSSYIPLLQVDSSDRNRISISDGTSFGLYILPDNASTWNKGASTASLPVSGYQFISSSHDVYFANSDIIAYKQNFVLPYSQKDIYSYNDLIAPSVFNFSSSQSTLDRHPYFYIFQNKITFEYYFCACWTKITHRINPNNGDPFYNMDGASPTDIYYSWYSGILSDGVWTFSAMTGSIIYYLEDYDLIWASVDVLDYTDSSTVIFEGSDAVKLGNLTTLFSVVSEDGNSTIKQGDIEQFSVISSQGLTIDSVTWGTEGNNQDTFINGHTGRVSVAADASLDYFYVVAENINGQGYSATTKVQIVPAQSLSSDFYIQPPSGITDYYSGNSYQFTVQSINGNAPNSVVWSITSSAPIDSGTSISQNGLLTLGENQYSGSFTIQASSINDSDTFAQYTIFVFTDPVGGGGGDTPTPSPTPDTQDVIDSVNSGFGSLGNKIDQLGNNIIAGLLEGLLRLFVPTTDELTAKMDSFKDWIDEQIPILAVPVALVQYTYDMFFGVTPELGVLTFPEVKWMDNILIERTELDLSQYTWLNDILPIIRTVLTVGCCLSFLYWVINKVKEVGKS